MSESDAIMKASTERAIGTKVNDVPSTEIIPVPSDRMPEAIRPHEMRYSFSSTVILPSNGPASSKGTETMPPIIARAC
eukprot:764054-Hanusia_phi.AAC.3